MRVDKWGYTLCSYCHGAIHRTNMVGDLCRWCVERKERNRAKRLGKAVPRKGRRRGRAVLH